MKFYDYIIIGASKAGMTATETLRENDPEASVLIINGEDRLPYKRTELTKKLASGFTGDDFALHPALWYGENRIDRVDSPAAALDGQNRQIAFASGQRVAGGKILLATGAVPKALGLPGGETIRHLRRADETEKIRECLTRGGRALVIGQGVEGVEIAEQFTLAGMSVLSLSSSSRLMKRWLDPFLSARLAGLLESKGVRLLYKRKVCSCSPGPNPVLSVEGPEGGEKHNADLILASVGVKADTALLDSPEGKEILGPGGIRCDSRLETAWEGVYAAGDVVDVPDGWATGLWHSAEHQGKIAALNMAGIPTEWTNLPIRLKCEVFGEFYFSMAYDRACREPDVREKIFVQDEHRYLKAFFKEGRLTGALMQGMKPFAKPLARLVVGGCSEEELKKNPLL